MAKTVSPPRGRLVKFVAALGRLQCRCGSHKWGKMYTDAGKDWCFGMGHHVQDCVREGCDYVRRHSPS